ncbi:hypothetical protein SCRM01_089c [Synechococcus phage S-CRM01]|uniref:hypothetical protein n=1 Tax=Synechococcus phage S-CRM01 TaxID=1026955 RepID=UPI000209E395|nr:hypothetical protein SCRM01_089c [Synechococcus phage S-CRM01]AEC53035.1 hypothetical protein SCRM01_089c [Synechococcus phage S-CRM01]
MLSNILILLSRILAAAIIIAVSPPRPSCSLGMSDACAATSISQDAPLFTCRNGKMMHQRIVQNRLLSQATKGELVETLLKEIPTDCNLFTS